MLINVYAGSMRLSIRNPISFSGPCYQIATARFCIETTYEALAERERRTH